MAKECILIMTNTEMGKLASSIETGNFKKLLIIVEEPPLVAPMVVVCLAFRKKEILLIPIHAPIIRQILLRLIVKVKNSSD